MKIHEYQSRKLLAEAGVPTPPSEVVESVEGTVAAYDGIGGQVVVKAQVFAGGRGQAGFVKMCADREQVRAAAEFMLGRRMVNRQTGPDGTTVRKLLIGAAVDIEKEYYVGMVIDRARRCPVVMVSREGGVEIEEVAARNPAAIVKEWLHPLMPLEPFQLRKLTRALGFTEKAQASAAERIFRGLASVFFKYDAALAEINPLVLTRDGRLLALDAKLNFDDNALFRHPELQAMHDESEDNPAELAAKAAGLSYIALDGNIGCIVNGAGLAMATMDLIKLHGGEPANFLDVGGGVTKDGAAEAFRIILGDPKVRGVLVNIFGGIAKCDLIAEALIAAGGSGFKVPVVVRLEGTNVQQARELLAGASVPGLISATDLTDAAIKACAAVQ